MAWFEHSSLYKEWTHENCESWQQIEKRGLKHFILTFGILRWGLWMFCVMSVVMILMRYLGLTEGRMTTQNLIVFNMGLYFLAGCLYGAIVWFSTCKSYHQELKDKSIHK